MKEESRKLFFTFIVSAILHIIFFMVLVFAPAHKTSKRLFLLQLSMSVWLHYLGLKKRQRKAILMVFVLVMSSCNKETEDEITPDSSQLVIGKSYQGGIIAYLLEPGDSSYNANVPHGLIAAPSDQSTGIYWHATNTGTTGATGFS